MRRSEGRDTVDGLYQRIADALQRSRPEPFAAPVTVAEIYQELAPYRTVREEVGFAMNADYEHALLRLLSGEGERLQLEPAAARELILRELKTPNPNVSIYREYAGCDVWVRPPGSAPAVGSTADDDLAWLDGLDDDELGRSFAFADVAEDERGGRSAGEAGGPKQASTGAPAAPPSAETQPAQQAQQTQQAAGVAARPAQAAPPSGGGAAASRTAPAPQREATRGAAGGTAPASAAAPASPPAGGPGPGKGMEATAASGPAQPEGEAAGQRCAFCDSDLPQGRAVRFCPFCGGDQSMRPCGACGEALEAGWGFCVACGATADGT